MEDQTRPEPSAKHRLRVFTPGGTECVTLFCWDEASGGGVRIRLERTGQQLEAMHANGYFRALCAIREQLEVEGCLLECFGASKQVYPSPMIESMGYGEKAYKLTLGRAALRSDLVGIFESGTDVAPTTVAAQREFYEQWLESLR